MKGMYAKRVYTAKQPEIQKHKESPRSGALSISKLHKKNPPGEARISKQTQDRGESGSGKDAVVELDKGRVLQHVAPP